MTRKFGLPAENEEVEVEEDKRAMSAIVQALLAVKNALEGEVGLARARLVAKVAAALADRSPDCVAHDLREAVQLAELMLACLSLGEARCLLQHLYSCRLHHCA